MKYTVIAALIAVALAASATAAGDGKHLFILSGQSNMVGLNPDTSFKPAVEKEFGNGNVIVVKDAEGGQSIKRWYKGDDPKATPDLYKRLMTKVTAAIECQKIQSVTFVWMQGERDAKEKRGEVYVASFKGIIAQLKADLKRNDVNFVIGRISDFDMENKAYRHWTMVRDAQVKVAETEPRGAWVNTDDLNNNGLPGKENNDLHYTKDGYKVLGERFAEKAIELIKKKYARELGAGPG